MVHTFFIFSKKGIGSHFSLAVASFFWRSDQKFDFT